FSIWPTIAAMRMAGRFRNDLRAIDDAQILRTCLSYDFREAIAAKLQAVGGIRVRWAAPWLIAGLSSAATLILLALLWRTLGFKTSAGWMGQVAGFIGIWVFYRSVRIAKLRASELRQADTRRPVF